MKRREFIILSGVGATSASLLSACGHPEEKLIPAFIPDEEFVPGIDYWKASTCGMCPAGCGIIVRTREHKANKIEGNPLHPVNRGALCARGQAGLEVLYNPDRIKGPMKRAGERGEGKWEEISWEDAIKTLADNLLAIEQKDRERATAFVTSDQKGLTAHLATRLFEAYGSTAWVAFSQYDERDPDTSKIYDIANATYLLSFGARFLETWKSPVMYSLAYGEFRHGQEKARGKFVQIEPRMSLTAANADQWLPVRAGCEAMVALAIANVIVREGLARAKPSAELLGSLQPFAPEMIAERVGIAAEKLTRVATEFARSERPLAIGGSWTARSTRWVEFLNLLMNNEYKKGGVLSYGSAYPHPFRKLQPRMQDRIGGIYPSKVPDLLSVKDLRILLLHQFDPIYMTPSARNAIEKIPFIASFSAIKDETTELADLLMPDHSYLESWGLRETRQMPEGPIINVIQPIVSPELNTRQTADVLIGLSRAIGGAVADSISFGSAEEIVKQAFSDLAAPISQAESSDELWAKFVERGVFIANAEKIPQATAGAPALSISDVGELNQLESVQIAGLPTDEFPLTLVTYEHAALGGGQLVNLPSLQELPDSMTSVIWGSWVEINPTTARSLGISEGDLVELSTKHGSVRVPAVLYPGIHPDVIAMPDGQGHVTAGRYASRRGANPAILNPGFLDTVGARVTKIEAEGKVIKFGTDVQRSMEERRR